MKLIPVILFILFIDVELKAQNRDTIVGIITIDTVINRHGRPPQQWQDRVDEEDLLIKYSLLVNDSVSYKLYKISEVANEIIRRDSILSLPVPEENEQLLPEEIKRQHDAQKKHHLENQKTQNEEWKFRMEKRYYVSGEQKYLSFNGKSCTISGFIDTKRRIIYQVTLIE